MRKYNLLLAVMVVALSACSVSNHVNDGGLVLKRKYNKGFFVSEKEAVVIQETKVTKADELSAIPSLKPNWSYTNHPSVKEMTPLIASADKNVVKHIVSKGSVHSKTLVEELNNEQTGNNVIVKPQHKLKQGIKKNFFSILGGDVDPVLLILLCFFLPPLAVYLKQNDITNDFIINVILTCLCGIPGMIHALIIVLKK